MDGAGLLRRGSKLKTSNPPPGAAAVVVELSSCPRSLKTLEPRLTPSSGRGGRVNGSASGAVLKELAPGCGEEKRKGSNWKGLSGSNWKGLSELFSPSTGLLEVRGRKNGSLAAAEEEAAVAVSFPALELCFPSENASAAN